ncbi:SDR family oxidoreductase [Pseudodesulfovibrio sp.]|uniref:SDR family oxidoreductase n=1 Tax=unclassified Pseudodesulfovibrio TaxID=2661612 RepID=UPI003B001DE2
MIDIPKFLVIGASGYLGSALLAVARRGHPDAMGLTSRSVPLEAPDLSVVGVDDMGYEWGVIAAEVSDPARWAAEPEAVRKCNVDGTLSLARQLAEMDIRPLWFSSDQVFDGRESSYGDDAPTSPVNEYGRQKAEVEARFTEASLGMGLVVRLSVVYDTVPGSGTLLDAMMGNLRSGGIERAASGICLSPTHIDDVAACLLHLMRAKTTGVVNVTAESISHLDLARLAAEAAGVGEDRVQPVDVADLDAPFLRPLGGVVLAPSPRLDGYKFLDVREALTRLAAATR